MTASIIRNKKSLNRINAAIIFFLALYFGEYLKEGVLYGIRLCVYNIIPTLFPFFLLSDYWQSNIIFSNKDLLGKIFEKTFKINSTGLSTYLLGNICGFPVGIKAAANQHKQGLITETDLKSLLVICNNPSAAFVILGVGAGMFSSINLGIKLYISVIFSSLILGIFLKPKGNSLINIGENTRQNFIFANSIKDASMSSILVSSYIIFFSSITVAISKIIKNQLLLCLICSFLEISSACNIIAKSQNILDIFAPCLASFALSFSGISVFLQAFSLLPHFISRRKYFFTKLLQGLLSFIITYTLIII